MKDNGVSVAVGLTGVLVFLYFAILTPHPEPRVELSAAQTTMPISATPFAKEQQQQRIDALGAAIFGIPPKATRDQVTTTMSVEELKKLSDVECVYIARWNTTDYLDPDGKVWNGNAIDGGYYPVLEKLPNGLVKTVEKDGDGTVGTYTVVYFQQDALSTDWRKTAWGEAFGNYDIEPNMPELCPLPEDARAKKQEPDQPGTRL